MHSECRITHVAHCVHILWANGMHLASKWWSDLQRGQGVLPLTAVQLLSRASLRGRNRGASWEIVAASKDSCNSAWGCWSNLFSTSGIYPARGLQKRKEMGKIYLPCRGDIGRGWLYIWIPTHSSLDDKTAQSILSLCNLSWAAPLAHMGHNVCTNLYLSTLCKKEPLS